RPERVHLRHPQRKGLRASRASRLCVWPSFGSLRQLCTLRTADEAAGHFAGSGIKMVVVGRDASPMKGRDGTDTSYLTNTILIGAGESYDVIFEAPAYEGPGPYDTYILYNRRYTQESNLSPGGSGGQRTEVRVYPAGTLVPQQYLNQHPDDLIG
ncbi:MAG: hypothetical protein ACK2UA_16565, partial [Anaerolineae bacterium]